MDNNSISNQINNVSEEINPLRIIQQELERMILRTSPLIQGLLYSENLSHEQNIAVNKIWLLERAAESKASNIAELFGEDGGAVRTACYAAGTYLKNITSGITKLIGGNSVIITAECGDGCDSVAFDIRRTNMILYQLVSNSIMHANVYKTRIKIKGFMRGSDFVISVSDNGKGVKAGAENNLFSAYKNITGAGVMRNIRNGYLTTGIGLAVSRKAANEMNGDVVYIPSHSGAVFELIIPQTNRTGLFRENAVFIPNMNEIELNMAQAMLFCLEKDEGEKKPEL